METKPSFFIYFLHVLYGFIDFSAILMVVIFSLWLKSCSLYGWLYENYFVSLVIFTILWHLVMQGFLSFYNLL